MGGALTTVKAEPFTEAVVPALTSVPDVTNGWCSAVPRLV